MKLIVPAVLALAAAAAGCAEVVERQELQDLDRKVDKLSMDTANRNDKQALLYEGLVSTTGSNEKKLAEIDGLVRVQQASIARLEDIVRTLQAQVANLSKGGTAPAPLATDPVRSISIEEILLEIETVLAQLRASKLRNDEAVTRLKPHAQHAAPRLLTEIRDSLTRVDYTKQLEAILGKFPPAELKVPLQGALGQAGVREAAARVVGATGDRELSKILEDHLAESDEDFRLAVGDALVRCRNGSGIPLLLQCLKSREGSTRTIAIAALRKVNRGEDFQYRPQLGAEENAAAIKAWEDWSDKFAKTIFE